MISNEELAVIRQRCDAVDARKAEAGYNVCHADMCWLGEQVPRLLDENDHLTAELAQAQKERDTAIADIEEILRNIPDCRDDGFDECIYCKWNAPCITQQQVGNGSFCYDCSTRNNKPPSVMPEFRWRGPVVDGEDMNGLEAGHD